MKKGEQKMGTLEKGARNAVEVCVAVTRGEHVLILTDRSTLEVGRAIANVAGEITVGNVKLLVLEECAKRPATELPQSVAKEIPWADVTFLAVQSEPGELVMRRSLIKMAVEYARHANIPGITRELMETGMCANYARVSQLTKNIVS